MDNNEELTKKIIAEKDKITLRYKQKLNNIKQHYGVEFDVEHLKDSSIKNITFVNLKYKNTFSNLSVVYDGGTRSFDYMNYEFVEARNVRGVSHKKMLPFLDKEYKLKLLVAEIERANSEYVRELNDIDIALENAPKSNSKYERTLVVDKVDETE